MLQSISLGDVMKPIAIERVRCSVSEFLVGSIVTRSIQAAALHYVKGLGNIHCFRGQCCQDNGLAGIRYVLPMLMYTMVDPRDPSKGYGAPVELEYLPIGKEAYEKDIMIKDKLNGDISTIDLLISCTDENWQKLHFEVVGPAKWRQDQALVAQAKEQYVVYKNLIEMSIARRVDETRYRELLAQAATRSDGRASSALPGALLAGGAPSPVLSVAKKAVSQISAAKAPVASEAHVEKAVSPKGEAIDVSATSTPSQPPANIVDAFNFDDVLESPRA